MASVNSTLYTITVARACSFTLAVAIKQYSDFRGDIEILQEDLEIALLYQLVFQPNGRWIDSQRIFRELAKSTDSYEIPLLRPVHGNGSESQLAFWHHEHVPSIHSEELMDLRLMLEVAMRSTADLDGTPLRGEVVIFVARYTYFLFKEMRKQSLKSISECQTLLKETFGTPDLGTSKDLPTRVE